METNLRQLPFFSDLSDEELEATAQRLRLKQYPKGASVFVAGESGDSMYIIKSGLVKVVAQEDEREKFILYLGPGNFFGEGSALFGGKHSASVYVVIDAELFVLRREDIMALLQQHPNLALPIIRELHHRLRLSLRSPIQTKELALIGVLGDAAPILARHLAQVTGEDVFLFDLGGRGDASLDVAALAQEHVFLTRADETIDAETLPARLSHLLEQYYWALLWVAPHETPLTLKAMDQADLRVVLGSAYMLQGHKLAPRHQRYADDNDAAIHQLARQIAQRQVGLALSSGNARGMAHIGVLKVLHEANIPIDMLAGTSVGALFGAMYAAGRTIDEMIEFANTVRNEYNFLTGFRNWDFCLPPVMGILKGNALLGHIRKWVSDKTFEDLNIPLAVVATDLISGEEVIFDQGAVAEAVRASMSVGVLLEPAQHDGRQLIDGGAVNPVPTRVLTDKGMNIILASNVIPTPQDRSRIRRMQRHRHAPHLVDIMLSEREIMEGELIRTRLHPLDVLIQPDVARFHVREYDKVKEIIQCGEEAAHQQIPYIRQLLAPRPRKPLHA